MLWNSEKLHIPGLQVIFINHWNSIFSFLTEQRCGTQTQGSQEQKLLLLSKSSCSLQRAKWRGNSHIAARVTDQGILPTFCLAPLRRIGTALLEESDQLIEGYVEINGKHDGGCKPKHLKGQNNALLNNSSHLSGTNQNEPNRHKKNSMVFSACAFPKRQGREMVCETLASTELQLIWEPDKWPGVSSSLPQAAALSGSGRVLGISTAGSYRRAPPAPPLSQGTSATKKSPPFLWKWFSTCLQGDVSIVERTRLRLKWFWSSLSSVRAAELCQAQAGCWAGSLGWTRSIAPCLPAGTKIKTRFGFVLWDGLGTAAGQHHWALFFPSLKNCYANFIYVAYIIDA